MTSRSGFIDTWRAIAVSMVIAAHLAQSRGQQGHFGWAGVFIFFFISGYVVSRAALNEISATGDFSARAFYIRRVFRIVPPLIFYLGSCLLLSLAGVITASPMHLVNGGLYVCNVSLVDCGWYAAHTWSLAFEEQFYLLFPLILLGLRRRGSVWLWATLAGLAALPAFIFPLPWLSRSGFLAVYALFGMGYWFARNDCCWRRWPAPNALFVLGCAGLVAPAWGAFGTGRLSLLVLVLAVPIMVMSADHPRFTPRRLFTIPVVILLGQASYSMYLWQQLFTGPAFSHLSTIANVAVVVAMMGACVLLYLHAERPLISSARRLASAGSTGIGHRRPAS